MTLHTFVLILHVLGATLVIGSVVFSLSLVSRRPFVEYSRQWLSFAWRMAEIAVGAQFLTGLYLFFSERSEFENNHLFWAKFSLYLLAGAVSGGMIKRRLKAMTADGDLQAAAQNIVIPLRLILLFVVAIVVIAVTMVENLPS